MSSKKAFLGLLAELDYFANRLKIDIRGIPCDYVIRAHERVKKLEMELERLNRIQAKIEERYGDVSRKIKEYMERSSFYIKTFVSLLFITVLAAVALSLIVALPGAPLSFLLPYLALVITIPVSFVVIIVLLFSYYWARLRSRYRIKELRAEKDKLEKRLNRYEKKIEDKQVELEDARTSYLEKELVLCKCHNEFMEAKELIRDLYEALKHLGELAAKRAAEREIRAKAELAKEIMRSLENYNSVCNYMHTSEFKCTIKIHSDLYREIEALTMGMEIGDPRGYIEVEFRNRKYRIGLGDFYMED